MAQPKNHSTALVKGTVCAERGGLFDGLYPDRRGLCDCAVSADRILANKWEHHVNWCASHSNIIGPSGCTLHGNVWVVVGRIAEIQPRHPAERNVECCLDLRGEIPRGVA